MKDTIGRENRSIPDRTCNECGKAYRPRRESSHYCSYTCMWKHNGGQNRKTETWWTNSRGYIEGRIWLDGKQKRVKQHRWIMEQHVGRSILPTEDVHHINGIRTDNRIENLLLVAHGTHTAISNTRRTCPIKGKKLVLSDEQRQARSQRMRDMPRNGCHVAAIAKAKGETA